MREFSIKKSVNGLWLVSELVAIPGKPTEGGTRNMSWRIVQVCGSKAQAKRWAGDNAQP